MMKSTIRPMMVVAAACRFPGSMLLALLLPAAALAQGTPFQGTLPVTLTTPSNASVGVPFNVGVNVNLTGVTGDCNLTQVPAVLGGYRITVPFDTSKLQFVSAASCGDPQFSAAPSATSPGIANGAGQRVSIAASQTNSNSPTGSVCVALLTFQPIAGGTTSLTVDAPSLSISSALQSCGPSTEGPASIPAVVLASAPVTICSPPSSAITFAAPVSSCANGTNSAAVPVTAGGTYVWTITNGTIDTNNGDNINFTNGSDSTSPVVLAVTVTDSSGCSSNSSRSITLSPSANTTITAPAGTCEFSTSNAASVPTGGLTYSWTISGGTITGGAGTNAITFDAGSAGTLMLSVTVTNAAGCPATGSTSVIVTAAPPTPTVTPGGPTSFCAGGSVTLTSSAASGNQWYLNGNPIGGATSQTYLATASGNYTVTNGGACASTSAPITVTANPQANALITAPANVCPNTPGVIASVKLTPGATYTWTVTNATLNSGQGTDAITFTAGATGPISIGVTVDAGGCPGSSNVTVTVGAFTPTITPSGPTSFCTGGNVTLTSSSANSYQWYLNGNPIGGSTSQTYVAASSGSYSVTAVDANGCMGTSAATNVTVSPIPPAPTITPGGPTSFCTGQSVTLTASGGSSYLWSTGATSQAIVASNPGSYSVTVTDSNGCSSTSAPTTVAVVPPPNASIAVATSLCANATSTASVLATSGATYTWTISNGTITGGQGTNAISFTVGTTSPVTLGITVNDSGCTNSGSASVVVGAFIPSITASGPTTFCSGGSVTLTATTGATYLWSNGATTQSIAVNASGNYSVTVNDGSGCTGTSAATAVTVNALPAAPTISTSGPTTFCAGGAVTLTASPSTSYLWSTGATTQSITVNATGSYSVTASDSNGCSATSSATAVTLKPSPSATITAASSVQPSSTSNPASVPGAGAGATYAWSIVNGTIGAGNGTSSITYDAPASGSVTLSVTVTGSNGCSATSSSTVSVSTALPAADLRIALSAGPDPVAPNGTLTYTLTVTNGGPDLATSLSVADTLPAALSNATVFGMGWSCTLSGTLVNCTTGNLAPFAASTITITGNAPASFSTLSNSASVTSSTPDPDSSNNSASIDVAVGGCTNAGPTLLSPPNGANDVPAAVNFSWTQVTGATSYNLWLGPQGGSPKVVGSTPDQTLSFSVGAGSFSWFVEAVFANCPPVRSGSFTFSVAPQPTCPTDVPVLNQPSDNAVDLLAHVSFSWSAVANATKYNLWATVDGSSPFIAASSTAAFLATDVPSGALTWWVEAAAPSCASTVSAVRHFTVKQLPTCPSTPASPIAPPQHGTLPNGKVTFSWVAAPSAVAYHVWLSIEDQPAGDIGTTTKTSLTRDLSIGGNFTWFVEAIFNGCPAVRSNTVPFLVSKPEPCSSHIKPVLSTPAANATIASPAFFSWAQAPGAAGYRIWVGVDGAAADVIATTPDTEGTFPVSSGANEWFVEAFFNGCASTFSEHSVYNVPAAANCGTAAPALAQPDSGATLTDPNVTFQWSAVPGAIGYQVWIAVNEGTPVRLDSTEDTTVQDHVSLGNLRWYVRALFNGCPFRDSESRTFSVQLAADCSARRPSLTSPVDGSKTVTSPGDLEWSAVDNAIGYRVWISLEGDPAVQIGPKLVTTPFLKGVTLPVGSIEWYVEAVFANCPSTQSSNGNFQVPVGLPPCGQPASPVVGSDAEASSGVEYSLHWNRVANAGFYEVQESPTPSFVNARTQTTTSDHLAFQHTNPTTSQATFYYRVRATSNCGSDSGFYSTVVSVTIHPVDSGDSSSLNGSTPLDKLQTSTYSIHLGGPGGATGTSRLSAIATGTSFTATTDQPWLTVSPSSGTVPPEGTTLTVTANPTTLPIGTSVGSVVITTSDTSASSHRTGTNGGAPTTVPVSLNVVQIVSPVAKSAPPPDALIIAAVAHANGAGATFESNVRLANTSPQLLKYLISFTPSGEAGFTVGKQTTIEVDPGQTVALDDVLRSWYGVGGDGTSATGVLDIRPLNAQPIISPLQSKGLANLYTFVSSRTFAVNSAGATLGQFIQATPFSSFVGKGDAAHPNILSLQQIAQSSTFRTNFGLVEGSGQPVSVLLSVFNSAGQKLGAFPVDLKAGEHKQLNSFLGQNNISLSDGRVEVQVVSGTGRVTAYASVLDNRTNDPLLVPAVQPDLQSASRYVVPGVADLAGPGANWRTDLRIFNASTAASPVTLTFYPAGNASASKSVNVMLDPGAVRQVDNILQSTFGVSGDSGSVSVTSGQMLKQIVVTARTYNQTDNGTFGQFVPAVTEADAAAVGTRPLQILQLEESNRARSNVGLAEVSGKPATVELSISSAESRVTPVFRLDLAANQFRQITGILRQLNITSYNTRVAVRVISGEGKVAAYASVIDNSSGDPTYVPAQ